MPITFLPGTEKALLAGLVASAQEQLHDAVIEAMLEARNLASAYRLTGQLNTTIHAVLPGESDRPMSFGEGMIDAIPGLTADQDEAYVVMHTIRRPGGKDKWASGDYGYYQENGPAFKGDGGIDQGGRHHLRNAGNSIRGKYPAITVGPVVPGSSFGGG
jgi:hypothetical protein